MFSMLGKFSADDILIVFLFSEKTGFGISCKSSQLESICVKCQILFSRKIRKNNINLSSVELAQRVVNNLISDEVNIS